MRYSRRTRNSSEVFANRYTVFIDACSLAGALKRDILLTLAEAEFFRVQWSEEVLAETERALVKIFEKMGKPNSAARAADVCGRVREAFPEALVSDYDAFLAAAAGLPDLDDRHVVAAALKGQASTIVTDNTRHFPEELLAQLGIEAKSADDFLADTIELDIGKAVAVIRSIRERYRTPTLAADDLLLKMETVGLTETADLLRPYVGSL